MGQTLAVSVVLNVVFTVITHGRKLAACIKTDLINPNTAGHKRRLFLFSEVNGECEGMSV